MIVYQHYNSRSNYNYNNYIYTNCEWYHHFHKNFELLYVMDGKLKVIIDGVEAMVPKNNYVLILPNSTHFFTTPEYSKVWIGVFSKDYISDFADSLKGKVNKTMMFQCSTTENAYLQEFLLNEYPKDFITLKACLYMVCARFLQTALLADRNEKYTDLAHSIIQYVEKHFQENITLADLSEEFGYDYHYMSRCFKNIFHMNFRDFLNQYRFDYAKKLILKSDKNMITIAMESGFGSLRNFNRVYKEISKTTPRQIHSTIDNA